MDRSVFARHFLAAAKLARDFSRKFLEEAIPDEMIFRVHLNSSYDGHAGPEVKLFPEDSSDERMLATKQLDQDGVVDLLWRDGYVPEWIDLEVVGVTEKEAILDVLSCGRFAEEEQSLYYASTGVAPFSAKGPTLPVNHAEGRAFSVYERSSCWSKEDLERVRRNASKVWSLVLNGPAFDDLSFELPLFPRLEIFELYGVRVAGPALNRLERMPRLRHFRATFGASPELDLASLPTMPGLQTLALRDLPPLLGEVARMAVALPELKELTIAARHSVNTDARLRIPSVERLTIETPTLPQWIDLPAALRWLSVHVPDTNDERLRELLAACPRELDSLSLRGSAATDELLTDLERFPQLKYLNAGNTGITKSALRKFADRRPGFKCAPNLRV